MQFIDFHVHPPVEAYLRGPFGPYMEGLEKMFGREFPPKPIDEIAAEYREQDGMAVLLAWDACSATGQAPFSSEKVAELVRLHPDVFIGFGSVDPHDGAAAVQGVNEAARLGMKGLKFHPSVQGFDPRDRRFFEIYEAADHHGLVCLFHTGYTGFGSGVPGGNNVRHEYANPMHLDLVAAAFPDLQVVMAHPSWPWQDEAIAVAQHKTNVWLELSGWSPRRFAPALVEAVFGGLSDRSLFGTDYPFLTPDKWIRDWQTLDPPAEVTRAVLWENAARLLGVGTDGQT